MNSSDSTYFFCKKISLKTTKIAGFTLSFFLLWLLFCPTRVYGNEPVLRVGLGVAKGNFAVRGHFRGQYRTWYFKTSGSRFHTTNSSKNYSKLILRPHKGKPVIYNSHSYRGELELVATKKGVQVINVVPMESYLRGVVPSEIGTRVPREAQKAQAIIARSWAIKMLQKHHKQDFDICNTPHCQVYKGIDVENHRSDAAVKATRGLILQSKVDNFTPYYYASCGGRTATPDEAWTGGHSSPHLMTVTCGNCLENPTNWQISIPIPTFLEKLRKGGFSLKHLRKIEVLKVSASGRISALMFLGSKSSVIISGHVLRRLLGANQVKSTLFTIAISGSESNSGDPISSLINSRKVKKQEKNGKMVLIKGKGYGHGVGLCQQGAIWLAARGKGYRSILDYYYQKIILKKMY